MGNVLSYHGNRRLGRFIGRLRISAKEREFARERLEREYTEKRPSDRFGRTIFFLVFPALSAVLSTIVAMPGIAARFLSRWSGIGTVFVERSGVFAAVLTIVLFGVIPLLTALMIVVETYSPQEWKKPDTVLEAYGELRRPRREWFVIAPIFFTPALALMAGGYPGSGVAVFLSVCTMLIAERLFVRRLLDVLQGR